MKEKKGFDFLNKINLFGDKSGKKNNNSILIIATVFGLLLMGGLAVSWADGDATQNAGTIHIYNSTDSTNVFATNPNLTAANEGVQFYFFVNLSNREVAQSNVGTTQTNITNVTIQFDQNWIIVGYNFTKHDIQQADELLTGGNTTDGNQVGSFDNRTVAGYHNFTWGASNLINATASNGTFSFSALIDVPGTYNISIRFGNATATGGVDVTNLTYIYIEDATQPNNVSFRSNTTGIGSVTPVYRTSPATVVNISHGADLYSAQNIYVVLAAVDTYEIGVSGFGYKGQEIGGINFTLLYENQSAANSTLVNKRAGINNSFSVNFTGIGALNISDGRYTVNITTVNDSKGNINYTGLAYNITLDRTRPTVTLAKAATSTKSSIVIDVTVADGTVGSGNAGIACTATGGGSGAITVTGQGGTQTTSQSDLSCASSYTYTINCQDHAGNVGTTSASIETDSCGGGSSGGGDGGSTTGGSGDSDFWTLTYSQADQELSDKEEITNSLSEGQRVKVRINAYDRYIGVVGLTATTAKINVTTGNGDKEATLGISEQMKFDVNADNVYDLVVTLNGISDGKADLSVVYIQEDIPAELREPTEEQVGEPTGEEQPKKGLSVWVWIIIGLVIIGAIIFFSSRKK